MSWIKERAAMVDLNPGERNDCRMVQLELEKSSALYMTHKMLQEKIRIILILNIYVLSRGSKSKNRKPLGLRTRSQVDSTVFLSSRKKLISRTDVLIKWIPLTSHSHHHPGNHPGNHLVTTDKLTS